MQIPSNRVRHYLDPYGTSSLTFNFADPSELQCLLDEVGNHDFEISRARKKRSEDIVRYVWVLIGKLASCQNSTKTEVYKHYVREVGDNFSHLCLRNDAVDTFVKNWGCVDGVKHVGWFCELEDSKIPGCTNVFAYYGISTYTMEQMVALVRLVQADCIDNNIPTMTPKELEEALDRYGRKL